MDVFVFIRIIVKNLKILIIVPLLSGVLMFLLSRDQPKEYSSSALIFTGITSNSSLENMGNARVDFFATNAAYNNLLSILGSRQIQEETLLRLLAQHLVLEKGDDILATQQVLDELQAIVPYEVKQLVVRGNAQETYENLKQYITQDKNNFLYGLLNFTHPYYSIKAISNVKAIRDGSSDVIELSYKNTDPTITYQTLKILIDVFLVEYGLLKKSQTNKAVEYFERQLAASANDLSEAEDRLLEFNKSNEIINYYEQTKHISSQQEKIQVKLQDLLMEHQAAQAVLQKLEAETAKRFQINLKNVQINEIRKSLIAVNKSIANEEVNVIDNGLVSDEIGVLYQSKQQLENELQATLDSLYIYEYNAEGIDIETLLGEWLKTVSEYESSKARLNAMQQKEGEFKKLYGQYAPLGAILKRIERGIEVKEREYLEILHHLGLARLKQQNEAMMANMKLLDPPHLPIDAKAGKAKLLVVVIALFSMILTVFALFLFELLDKRIKTPSRFEKLSGLPVQNAMASFDSKQKQLSQQLNHKSLKALVESIAQKYRTKVVKEPLIIQVFSNWQGEGKSELLKQIQMQLFQLGIASERLSFMEQTDNETAVFVKNWHQLNSYDSLLSIHPELKGKIVFSEIPAFADHVLNIHLLTQTKQHIFIADANRIWTKADDQYIQQLKNYGIELKGVLNQLKAENMEELIGEIPKARSKFRKFVKHNFIQRFF